MITEEKMELNKYGTIAEQEWFKTEILRDNVLLDEFIIMPNHIHGIIRLVKSNRGPARYRPTARRVPSPVKETFGKPVKGSIPTIVRSYKSAVTKKINELNNEPGDKIWQKNYHCRIIGSKRELENIRSYIRKNPANWVRNK